ncbi:MAG: AAA family ATPase [Acidimicrobiales bacterium]|nr:AAA family ATPase [Acidimicrobiales bacterium]
METASFGAWVRRRRVTLDLTQAELARRVACAPITVRKIEGDERRPSKVMAERLAEALELDGESADRFVAAARAVVSPARLTTPAAGDVFGPGGDLPAPPHRIVGREAEIADALDRLAVAGGPARLLTVVGPPGVGKTRFAVEVAERALRKFDVPPVFVDLSVIRGPDEFSARLAATVATPSAATVDVSTLATHALRRTPTLLVLDNFEHVLDAADHVAVLLEGCPDLTCLVTSRTPLDLYGEHCLPLDPLAVDPLPATAAPGNEAPIEPEAAPPALALLGERASAVDPRLAGVADDPAAVELCRLLDGLPLAIELAARRLRDHTPTELVERLHGGGGVLLGAGRGRDVRLGSAAGSIGWSYDLLDPPCRHLLRVAGTLSASFDAALLASLAGEERRSEDALQELVRQGLVRATLPAAGRTRRYDLLMVVRQFARDRQVDEGEDAELSARHARVVADRATAESPGIDAWPERRDIDALALIEPDALTALAWCFGPGGDPRTGRRLLLAMGPLWYFRGQVTDLLRWSTLAHQSLHPDDPPADHYRAAYYAAVARWEAADLDGAVAFIRQAVAGAAEAGDATWLAEALGIEQLLALSAGDIAAAAELTERCTTTADAAGREWIILTGLRAATLARLTGDLDTAEEHLARAEALIGRSGTWTRAMVASGRADLALDRGRPNDAVALSLEALEAFLEVDSVVHAAARTARIADALALSGEDEQAVVLSGLVDEWCDALGAPLHPMAAFPHAVQRAALETRVGDRFAVLLARGRSLPVELATVRQLAGAPPASVG